MFLVDEGLDRLVRGDGLGLQPRHQPRNIMFALVGAQTAQKLSGEGHGQGRVASGEGTQHAGLINILSRRTQQPLSPNISLVAKFAYL